MNNEELIRLCKQGNRQAEKELFFRFAGKVLSICRRYASSEQEAKDYMQESFLQIFKNIKKFKSEKGEFEGWLFKVCTNKVLDILKNKKKNIRIVYMEILPDVFEDSNDSIENLISIDDLLLCIQALPNGYRTILNLYVFEGLRHQEIAEELNISVGTSRSQYSRAKILLRQIILKKTGVKYERC
ncbi:MAG: RNA polymerase sigma factor [Saprospiraceae bacterium]